MSRTEPHEWQRQLGALLRSGDDLRKRYPDLDWSGFSEEAAARFPMAITPYYADLIERPDPTDPIFRMAIASGEELFSPDYLGEDPLGEQKNRVTTGLIHRYRDRALLLTTSHCAVYCRHCTRKRFSGSGEALSPEQLREAVGYLTDHPEIKDLLISGGDPGTLPTPAIEKILSAVRQVPSLEVIRFCTRTPVTLPMRFDDELIAVLRNSQPLWVVTHFNHPKELTPEATAALGRLADGGIPVANQAVLLKGVNDAPAVIESLMRKLVNARVRPTYLFQCDLIRGVEHLRTPISAGLAIMEHLRGRLGSLAIPTFAVDTEGYGKVPLLPQYLISQTETETVFRTYEGKIVSYPEPIALPSDNFPRK